ncbi:GNAT family N-acetyltransferase [Streptomyces sp. bgisy091]|uniref:GNAT family N-acetyltransferase n=1 Tax=Streptomyces sp. bgisy091 TaxID=3413778 RepID=UPI003D70F700
MEIVDHRGLSVAHIAASEIAERPWARADTRIDLVRVTGPGAEYWDALAANGFLRKPNMLTWMAELGESEDEFLESRLSPKRGRFIRRCRRQAESELEITVHDSVRPELLDPFLELYRQQIEGMRHGVAIAVQQRERILSGEERYFAVSAWQNGELVGGCVVRECPEEGAVRLRFSAVSPQWRARSLSRALYFMAMREGRERGHRWVTLGDDANLYGHVVKAGLIDFKAGMGFQCLPSQDFHDPAGVDQADLLLDLGRLDDPVVVFGYTSSAPADRSLRACVLSGPSTSLRPFELPFLDAPVHIGSGVPAGATAP